jgi:hypothetical protein
VVFKTANEHKKPSDNDIELRRKLLEVQSHPILNFDHSCNLKGLRVFVRCLQYFLESQVFLTQCSIDLVCIVLQKVTPDVIFIYSS